MGPKSYNNVNNDTVKRIVEIVTQRQMCLTCIFIGISLAISYVIDMYIDNSVLQTAISVALIAVSFPTTAAFSKKISLDIYRFQRLFASFLPYPMWIFTEIRSHENYLPLFL